MRDTGPIGKSIDGNGDTEAAAAYMGVARTVLGLLTNDMRANGLSIGTRTANLPDGASIRVVVVGNNKRVFISAPVAGPGSNRGPEIQLPLSETANPPIPLPGGVILVGESDDNSFPYNGHPVWWTNPNTINQVPFLGGTYTGGCSAVSADGSTIVGGMQGDIGGHGFRKVGNIIEDIGSIGSAPDAFPTGVSGDGEAICANCRVIFGTTGYLPYMWRRSTGFVALDTAGSTSARAYCISPNGRYIGGTIFIDSNSMAAIWDNGKLRVLVNNTALNVVIGVADTGRACGSADNTAVYWEPDGSQVAISARYTTGAAACSITQDGTAIVGTLNAGLSDSIPFSRNRATQDSSSFLWTAQSGMQVLGTGSGAYAISPRGTLIGGEHVVSNGGSGSVPVGRIWHRSGSSIDIAQLPDSEGYVLGIGGPSA